MTSPMDETRKHARVAGLLYLAVAIIAPFSLSYVPSQIDGSQGNIADSIQAHETLLRLSLVSEMAYQIIEVFITLALYNLFRKVNSHLALQMLVLGLLPIPIIFLNQLTEWGAITLAVQDGSLATIPPNAKAAFAGFLHGLHNQGIVIAGTFWGLWLLPLGRLIILSGFLPKVLGLSVIVGGVGYLVHVTATLALPSLLSAGNVQSLNQIASVMMIGEVPVIFGLFWIAFRPPVSPLKDGQMLREDR